MQTSYLAEAWKVARLTVALGQDMLHPMRVLLARGRTWATVAMVLLTSASSAVALDQLDPPLERVPQEEYQIYDRIIQSKFLTSQTRLVMINRLTVNALRPDLPPPTVAFFHEQNFFQGRLQEDVVVDFVFKARRHARLEARFDLGVHYRFYSDGASEEPSVFLAPIPAGLSVGFDPTTIGVLAFSRVGFNTRENQALAYVEDRRPDGTGAGFLILLHRSGPEWTPTDTEVLWSLR
ncbi:MAG: hypothetical protein ACE5NA_02150 [Nitrospiraceae bacterium]